MFRIILTPFTSRSESEYSSDKSRLSSRSTVYPVTWTSVSPSTLISTYSSKITSREEVSALPPKREHK